MKLRLGKKTGFVLAIAGATAVGGISTAAVIAAVPDASGAIHGCYLKNAGLFDGKGTVRIIDTATDSCKTNENAISWSQTGPKGDPGEGAEPGTGPIGLRTDLDNAVIDSSIDNFDLSHRTLRGVRFVSTMKNVDFSYSIFENTPTSSTRLEYSYDSEFMYADMSSVPFNEPADFNRANLTGANMSGHSPGNGNGEFRYRVLDSNLTNTNLSNNAFVGNDFTGSNLSTANLSGSTWSDVICPDGTNSGSHGASCAGHLVP